MPGPIPYPKRAWFPPEGTVITVVGSPGSGKSTLACRAVANDVVRFGRKLVALDMTGDIAKYLTDRFGVPKAWVARVQTAAQADAAMEWTPWNREPARVAVLTSKNRNDDDEWDRLCGAWVDLLNRDSSRGWVGLCDEAELLFDNRKQLRGRHLYTIKLARNRAQRIVLCTQRPQYLATVARSNTEHACVMHCDSRQVVEYGCREFGEGDFERALSLPKLKYLYRPRYRDDENAPLEVRHALVQPIPWR